MVRRWLSGLVLMVLGGVAVGCVSEHGAVRRDNYRCTHGVPHVVQPGDTLYRIALSHGLTRETVAAENHITDPSQLRVGQVLCLGQGMAAKPVAMEAVHPPTRLAPIPSIHERSPTEAPAVVTGDRKPDPKRADIENVKPDPKTVTELPTRVGLSVLGKLDWPLRGVVYGRFGRRGSDPHDGIDLAAPAGTPVHTAGAGRVLYAGEQRGYGLMVIVEHAPGRVTLYAHNRDLRVREGQEVRDHQVIATVGESGRTTGPHLHFEVRINGIAVDPLTHLGPAPPAG